MTRKRLRDLGIKIGSLETGPLNAITDVAGLRVGHKTLIGDDPVAIRTGVTAIHPHGGDIWKHHVAAGFHRINGGGEMTGTQWIEEAGMLNSPICLTSVWSVGLVRDTLFRYTITHKGHPERIHRPIVAETNDSTLNDGVHQAISPEDVIEALETASSGPVAEGAVGGGTGMMCFEFKSGIGTSSRRVQTKGGEFTVGVLTQANFGTRSELMVDGVHVGRQIGYDEVGSPRVNQAPGGSIILIVATDAPLLPIQCKRLAQRAAFGLGLTGGTGHNLSGDLVLAFSTGNLFEAPLEMAFLTGYDGPTGFDAPVYEDVRMLPNRHLNPLFQGVIDATQEAILNAITAAETMTGAGGRTVNSIPLDRLQAIHRAVRPAS